MHLSYEFQYHFIGCDFSKTSCHLLHHLSEKNTFDFENYSDIDMATMALSQGAISGFIYFHANFSEALFVRMVLPLDIDSETLNQSTVQVCIDINFSSIPSLKRVIPLVLQISVKICSKKQN